MENSYQSENSDSNQSSTYDNTHTNSATDLMPMHIDEEEVKDNEIEIDEVENNTDTQNTQQEQEQQDNKVTEIIADTLTVTNRKSLRTHKKKQVIDFLPTSSATNSDDEYEYDANVGVGIAGGVGDTTISHNFDEEMINNKVIQTYFLHRLLTVIQSFNGNISSITGWSVIIYKRRTGLSVGIIDVLYYTTQGQVLRSRAETLIYLGLLPEDELSGNDIRQQNHINAIEHREKALISQLIYSLKNDIYDYILYKNDNIYFMRHDTSNATASSATAIPVNPPPTPVYTSTTTNITSAHTNALANTTSTAPANIANPVDPSTPSTSAPSPVVPLLAGGNGICINRDYFAIGNTTVLCWGKILSENRYFQVSIYIYIVYYVYSVYIVCRIYSCVFFMLYTRTCIHTCTTIQYILTLQYDLTYILYSIYSCIHTIHKNILIIYTIYTHTYIIDCNPDLPLRIPVPTNRK